jgi:hypothetical protein
LEKVVVEWVDSKIMHGWQDNRIFEGEVAQCESVGFLYEDGVDFITLVMGQSDSDMVVEGFSIPRGCIKSVKKLRAR